MAVYKVPQDVEAEDHLIGPFGFRQFIYLIIAAAAGFVAFLLAKISIVLMILPAPVILFFFIIALPLRKDQPTEVYLAAVLQYKLKSKIRMWQPDGIESTVEITAPKKVEIQRTKDITEDEALDRLGHLAQIMDTHGWAARGVFNPDIDSTGNVLLADHVVEEAKQTEDILDAASQGAKGFDQLIDQQRAVSKQAAIEKMNEATTSPSEPEATYQQATSVLPTAQPTPQQESAEDLALLKKAKKGPYPTSMHQQVIKPIEDTAAPSNVLSKPNTNMPLPTTPLVAPVKTVAPTPQTTSDLQRSADIMNLAHRPDISIQTIAKEAKRVEQKNETQEVVIRLH